MDYKGINVEVKDQNNFDSPQLIKGGQSPDTYNELAYTEESIDDIGSADKTEPSSRDSLAVSDEKDEIKQVDLLSPQTQIIGPNKPCVQLSPGE